MRTTLLMIAVPLAAMYLTFGAALAAGAYEHPRKRSDAVHLAWTTLFWGPLLLVSWWHRD